MAECGPSEMVNWVCFILPSSSLFESSAEVVARW